MVRSINRAGSARPGVDGQAVRDHVEREIVPEEAAIVRRIFAEIAAGRGFGRVAASLNADRIASPTGQGWAMTGVRELVLRDLYRGRIVWGKTRWKDKNGTKVKVDVPESEWPTVEAPGLRIVSEELWAAAHSRLERTRQTYLRQSGAASTGGPSPGSTPRISSPASSRVWPARAVCRPRSAQASVASGAPTTAATPTVQGRACAITG